MQHTARQAVVGEDGGRIPYRARERGQKSGLLQENHALRRHSRRKKRDERRGDAKEMARRNFHQTHEHHVGESAAERDAEQPAEQKAAKSRFARRRNTVKEQHDFRTFAQDGDGDDNGQRHQGLGAFSDLPTDMAQIGGHFAAVAGHPDVVPGQHDHGEREDARVEDFLAEASQGVGQRAGKDGDQRRPDQASCDAAGDPEAPARNATRHSEDDADDQAGLDHFTKDNYQSTQHFKPLIRRSDRHRWCPGGNRRKSGIGRD